MTECPMSDLPPDMCWHCRGHQHLDPQDPYAGEDDDTPTAVPSMAFPARVHGMCRRCGHPIERGELIVGGDEGWVHDECVPF